MDISIEWQLLAGGFGSVSSVQWIQLDEGSDDTYVVVTDTTFELLYKFESNDNNDNDMTISQLNGFDGWVSPG